MHFILSLGYYSSLAKEFSCFAVNKKKPIAFQIKFSRNISFLGYLFFVRRRVVRPRFPQNNLFLFAFALLCFMSHVQITLDKWNSNVSDYSKTVWFDSQVAFHVSEKRRLVSFLYKRTYVTFLLMHGRRRLQDPRYVISLISLNRMPQNKTSPSGRLYNKKIVTQLIFPVATNL